MPDPMMPMTPAEDQSTQESGGYTICITVAPDGSMSVGVESEAYEAAEEAGAQDAGMTKPAEQPVASIEEALAMVKQIYRSNGQAPDQGAAEDEAAGYSQAFSA